MIWMHISIINIIYLAEATTAEKTWPLSLLLHCSQDNRQQKINQLQISLAATWQSLPVATHSWIRCVFMQIGDLPQNISDSLVSMSKVLWSNRQTFMEIQISS